MKKILFTFLLITILTSKVEAQTYLALLCGGFTSGGSITKSCEITAPGTAQTCNTKILMDMPAWIYFPVLLVDTSTATDLPAILCGFYGSAYRCWLFVAPITDPGTGSWVAITTTTPTYSRHYGMPAVAFNGINYFLDDNVLETLTLTFTGSPPTAATGVWAILAVPLKPVGRGACMVGIGTGATAALYVFGGVSSRSILKYDVTTNVWTEDGTIPFNSAFGGCSVIPGTTSILVGVNTYTATPSTASAGIYDTATKTWTSVAVTPVTSPNKNVWGTTVFSVGTAINGLNVFGFGGGYSGPTTEIKKLSDVTVVPVTLSATTPALAIARTLSAGVEIVVNTGATLKTIDSTGLPAGCTGIA